MRSPKALLPARSLRHGISAEILQDRSFSEVLDAALDVHNGLGPGHLDKTYQNALCVELSRRGRVVHREPTFSVMYKNQVVGTYVADVLVDERVLVKVTALAGLNAESKTDTLRGLVAGGVKVGVLFNFALPELFFARIL
ncbi:MAG: GxxExxY protein [Deltaproteobacteria bacterium]|nr:GxxExxY protein [Deltaproteobacteria bacterium]